MKRLWALCVLVFAFCVPSVAYAVPLIGSISSSPGGGLVATGSWGAGGAALSWRVSSVGSLWQYDYRFEVDRKDISHVLTEVSPTFTVKNIRQGTSPYDGPDLFGNQGGSSPGIPADLWSLKFTPSSDTTDFSWTIVSDREPMWGDFYAKDGVDRGVDVYAYNASFGLVSGLSYTATAPFGFLLVPDTNNGSNRISEPNSLLMFAAAFLLFGVSRRRLKTVRV